MTNHNFKVGDLIRAKNNIPPQYSCTTKEKVCKIINLPNDYEATVIIHKGKQDCVIAECDECDGCTIKLEFFDKINLSWKERFTK